jgi:hypothetical protein
VFTKLLIQVAGDAAPVGFPRAPGKIMQEPLQAAPWPLPLPDSHHRRLPLRRPAAHASFFRTTH